MLFNSVDFFLLLAIALLLYWRSSSLFWRQNCLLAASLIFYAYWFPPYLLLFFAFSAAAYVGGLQIAAGRRQALKFTVILLLAILGIFKYTQFSFNLFNGVTGGLGNALGVSTVLPEVNIRVPLGISFICFQLVGYLVDVARRQAPAEKSFRLFTLFIGFFPQLIAGPICRAEQLMPQLKKKQAFDSRRFASGVLLVAIGLVLKVAFADGLAPFVERVFSAENYAEQPTMLAAVSFGVQIFCDFWGYSTMAVGAAQLFGIEVPINFYLPYFSTRLREFWRRWHITLSDWFRDYLYIPLGGSRRGELITARNLLVTMTLCGLWHGASLTFVVWGLLHGLYLVVEHRLMKTTKLWQIPFWAATFFPAIRWVMTMAFVTTTWIFFRAETLGEALSFTQAAWSHSPFAHLGAVDRSSWVLLLGFAIAQVPLQRLIDSARQNRLAMSWQIVLSGWLLVLAVIMSAGESYEFIYFGF